MLRFAVALALVAATGCGKSNDPDIDFDAGLTDAGLHDAGPAPVDAGEADAGHEDAGHEDAGHLDAGHPDAGHPDAGHPDAGHPDAGLPDAGPTPADAGSSIPTDPIAFIKNSPFTVTTGGVASYVYVPTAYDSTHQTPITLFVWLHGCGGNSAGDVYTVSPGGAAQSWISLAVGGQEGNCWDVDHDTTTVLAAIDALRTHFNIKPKGIIVGGYSSGGDLSYRIAFYNANRFAGVLVENTSPFRDTGSTQAASLAAASWKFNVVHVAHLQDTTYPIAGVRTETNAMTAAGFPIARIEVDGTHYDAPGATVNHHAVPGTSADVATYLFPNLSKGWSAP